MSEFDIPHRKLPAGRLVIASHNEGKVREIRALLQPYGIEPVSAGSLGLPEPPERALPISKSVRRSSQSA